VTEHVAPPDGSWEDGLAVDLATGDGSLVVRLAGELDLRTAADLRRDMDSWPVTRQTSLDITGLRFVDSTGIGCLMKLQRLVADAGGILIARGASPSVRRVLETTGLHRHIALLD
jgi:anti-sigma B factor antagonist/stage II sporulation protein AA (anti-sigma F factor antagonist)